MSKSPATGSPVEVEDLLNVIQALDDLDNRLGGGFARRQAARYLDDVVAPLLRQRHPSTVRAQLFVLAGKATGMTGWMSYDDGRSNQAQQYMTRALRLCAEGNDRVLSGQLYAGMAHVALSSGRAADGLRLAEAGCALVHRSGSPRGLMRLHAIRARAHAALGHRSDAARALTEAERALDRSSDPAEESRWVRSLGEHYLQTEMSCCFRDLGDARNAETFALASVYGNSGLGRRQAVSRAVLAWAQLQHGHLDQALTTADGALTGVGGVRSARGVRALREFAGHLMPHLQEAPVQRFLERLSTAGY
ncbi:hypothetical protein V1227_06255 [Lentzea sp. DG1S-22]|uniref:hypothetical protein n=1 Tax=Lentzea sp. DG1S-22 TaxID=3108822 RepID=UPI002E7945C1|nr:hypothetical protein [Lentzea sp. DG1S-22]WVH82355.1 hypothetical protein V1227_06255 [Lentzea sp. DG1S-22]